MLELLRVLVEEVNTRGHLAFLLKGNQLTVLLRTEEEEVILKIEDDQLTLEQRSEEALATEISGNDQIMCSLLNGEVKLRNASKNRELNLKSSLRVALLLESLFILAMPKTIQKSGV